MFSQLDNAFYQIAYSSRPSATTLKILDCCCNFAENFRKTQWVVSVYDVRSPASLSEALEQLRLARQQGARGLLLGWTAGLEDMQAPVNTGVECVGVGAGGVIHGTPLGGDGGGGGGSSFLGTTLGDGDLSVLSAGPRPPAIDLWQAKSAAAELDCLSVETPCLMEVLQMLARDFDFDEGELSQGAGGGTTTPQPSSTLRKENSAGSSVAELARSSTGCSEGRTTSSSSSATAAALQQQSSSSSSSSDPSLPPPLLPPNHSEINPLRSVSMTSNVSTGTTSNGYVGRRGLRPSGYVGRRTIVEMNHQVKFLKPSLEEYDLSVPELEQRHEKLGLLANVKVAHQFRDASAPIVVCCFGSEDAHRRFVPLVCATATGQLIFYKVFRTKLELKQRRVLIGALSSSSSSGGVEGELDNNRVSSGSGRSSSSLPGGGTAGGNTKMSKPAKVLAIDGGGGGTPVLVKDRPIDRYVVTYHNKRRESVIDGVLPGDRSIVSLDCVIQAHRADAGPVTSLLYSPCGTRLFTGSRGGEAKVFDVSRGKQDLVVCYEDTLPITAAVYVPAPAAEEVGVTCGGGGGLVIYAGGQPSPCLRLINIARHELVQKLKIDAEVCSLAFDSGRFVFCGGVNGCVYVVELYATQRSGGGTAGNSSRGGTTPGEPAVEGPPHSSSSSATSSTDGAGIVRSPATCGSIICSSGPLVYGGVGAQPHASTGLPASPTPRMKLVHVQYQFGARGCAVTALAVQPRSGRPPLLVVCAAASTSSSLSGGSSTITGEQSNTTSRPPRGETIVGLVELIYREKVLIMMRCVQRLRPVLGPQASFCCDDFLVTGGNAGGELSAHALGDGGQAVESRVLRFWDEEGKTRRSEGSEEEESARGSRAWTTNSPSTIREETGGASASDTVPASSPFGRGGPAAQLKQSPALRGRSCAPPGDKLSLPSPAPASRAQSSTMLRTPTPQTGARASERVDTPTTADPDSRLHKKRTHSTVSKRRHRGLSQSPSRASSGSNKNPRMDDGADHVALVVESPSVEDKFPEDVVPACFALNNLRTVLAVGDSRGGLTLLRRSTTRKRPAETAPRTSGVTAPTNY